jgi:glycerol uptake facilitator-like aquaporin
MTPVGKRDQFPSFDPTTNGLTVTQGVLCEAFFAFTLIFVAMSVHDTENRTPAVMPSLAIACCIGIGLFAAVRITSRCLVHVRWAVRRTFAS